MNKILCTLMLLLTTSCASIVSKSSWTVTIDSNPTGANLVVLNKSGNPMQTGTAPMTLTLESGDGYFGKARYEIEASLPGYNSAHATFSARFNGWYVGNLLFGGLIGFLIVDPLTGAMWKLDERTVINLGKVAP